jgi:hypothetical protein
VFRVCERAEEVAATIRKLIATAPERAVALCEAFLAGCHAKTDEIDDSSGNFGMFAKDLICLWIKARQAAGDDPDKTASTLIAWMDDDPYAFCYQIEKEATAAFNKLGMAAFQKQIRGRFEAAFADPSVGSAGVAPRCCERSSSLNGTSGRMSLWPSRLD